MECEEKFTEYERSELARNRIRWLIHDNRAAFSDADVQHMRRGIYHLQKWLKMFMTTAQIDALTPLERAEAEAQLSRIWAYRELENTQHTNEENARKAALFNQLASILTKTQKGKGMNGEIMLKNILKKSC